MEEETILKFPILWRGEKFIIEINSGASLKDLGNELQKSADVKADTMRLIVPEISGKSSSLLYPFSDEHSRLTLDRIVLKEVELTFSWFLSLYMFLCFSKILISFLLTKR